MNTDKRRRAAVIFVFFLLIGIIVVLLFFLFAFRGGSTGKGAGEGPVALSNDSFNISGDVTSPIRPGHPVPLNLTITNTRKAPMVVTGLRVKVAGVTAPAATVAHPCTVADFRVTQVPKKFTITIGASAKQTLLDLGVPAGTLPQLTMRDTLVNQDGCKGATLSLSYSATGDVVSR